MNKTMFATNSFVKPNQHRLIENIPARSSKERKPIFAFHLHKGAMSTCNAQQLQGDNTIPSEEVNENAYEDGKHSQVDLHMLEAKLQKQSLLQEHFMLQQKLQLNQQQLKELQNLQQLEIKNVEYKRKIYEGRAQVEKLLRIYPQNSILLEMLDILNFDTSSHEKL